MNPFPPLHTQGDAQTQTYTHTHTKVVSQVLKLARHRAVYQLLCQLECAQLCPSVRVQQAQACKLHTQPLGIRAARACVRVCVTCTCMCVRVRVCHNSVRDMGDLQWVRQPHSCDTQMSVAISVI